MRRLLFLPLLALLLVPAVGCKTSDRFGRGTLGKNDAKEGGVFTGSQPAGGTAATAGDPTSLASGGSTSKRSGVLAGSIIDGDARLRPNARIQIIDIDALPTAGVAPLTATSNAEGYFDISGLDPGRTYRLIARVQEGRRVLVGSARVVPPNPRVRIYLTDELPAGDNTGVPATMGAPVPGRSGSSGSPRGGPMATIGAPINNPEEGVTTPLAGDTPMPPAVNTTSPEHIARERDKKVRDGFESEVPDPKVNIPGPGRGDTREKPMMPNNSLPAPPSSIDETPAPMSSAIPAVPRGDADRTIIAPDTPTVVPSCVLVGKHLENFTLYDRQGRVYEFKKQRTGKLVLLDFWFTDCPPCRAAMPHLNDLQANYGKHGLEIIGITYEPGATVAEKQQKLDDGLRRYGLNPRYPLLFGGGGKGDCPVAKRLEVGGFPTLILLDEKGKIIWQSTGLDREQANKLAWTIYQKVVEQKKLAQR